MSLDLAVIGGTGLYQFDGLADTQRHAVDTPFGAPSARIVSGDLHGHRVAFLARHGEDHRHAPHRVNYRANIWALHHLGARRIVGVNAVGGIRKDMGPRVLVVPDQLIDYTHGRPGSFCDVDGASVEHIDFTDPYDADLRRTLLEAAAAGDVRIVDGGCYGATQGPRLETRAEITRMRRDGCDLVGMTGMPEAALAREKGVAYACLALVANWAAGCGDQTQISLDEIMAHLDAATRQVPPLLCRVLDQR